MMVRFFSRVMILGLLMSCFLPCLASAETTKLSFDHNLGIGTGAKSFEHKIDLPADWPVKGLVFVKRQLALSGKLVIEREELTQTYYYVKVRLLKTWLVPSKGNIQIVLEGAPQASQAQAPEAAAMLGVKNPPLNPKFSWQGLGKYTAITLLDRGQGQTVWERIILNNNGCQLDEGDLVMGHRYMYAVKQSDESAKYSKEAQAAFRIDAKYERCTYCYGNGYTTCSSCGGSGHIVTGGGGPNQPPVYSICHSCSGTGSQRCTFCNGTGQMAVPVIVYEPAASMATKAPPRIGTMKGTVNGSPVSLTFDRREWTIVGTIGQKPVSLKIDHDKGFITGTVSILPVQLNYDWTSEAISLTGNSYQGFLQMRADWRAKTLTGLLNQSGIKVQFDIEAGKVSGFYGQNSVSLLFNNVSGALDGMLGSGLVNLRLENLDLFDFLTHFYLFVK